MANHIQNDRGEWVIAEGAPASQARVAVEYPALIERINALYAQHAQDYGARIDLAVEMIRDAGITSYLETSNILMVSMYSQEGEGTITDLVRSIRQRSVS